MLNQTWFKQELIQLGHEVITCGMGPEHDVELDGSFIHLDTLCQRLPPNFTPDRLLIHDNSSPLLYSGFSTSDIPTVFYSVDTHHHHFLHRMISRGVDRLLVAQKDYIPAFLPQEGPTTWLPVWSSLNTEPNPAREYGAVFIGTLNSQLNPQRVRFFEELGKEVPILCKSGHFPDYFTKAHIVINQTVKGDLNFRVFEAMMCGAMLLTERNENGLTEIFTPGHHIATYNKGQVLDAAEKIRHYLANPGEAQEIAAAGHAEVIAKHRAQHRAPLVAEELRLADSQPRRKSYLAGMANFALLYEGLITNQHKNASSALVLALRDLSFSLTANEPITNELACLAVRACFAFDMHSKSNKGQSLIEAVIEAHPKVQLLAFVRIYRFLQENDKLSAHKLAREIFANQDTEIISKADMAFNILVSGAAQIPPQ